VRYCRRCGDGAQARIRSSPPSEANMNIRARRAEVWLYVRSKPGSSEWLDVERRWLVPAVAALRSGRLKRLDLSAADRRFSVGRGLNLRFWRRPRPWWESYGIQ